MVTYIALSSYPVILPSPAPPSRHVSLPGTSSFVSEESQITNFAVRGTGKMRQERLLSSVLICSKKVVDMGYMNLHLEMIMRL